MAKPLLSANELPPLAQELDEAELLHKVVAPELEQILALCRKDELLELFGRNIEAAGGLKRDLLLHRIRENYYEAEETEDIEALLLLVKPLCSATDSPALSPRWNQLRNRVARPQRS